MPNVAGREFAYTPQGMAAAEQYKQSLGMRGGGMMGFRPVGYQGGGGVGAGFSGPEGGVPIGAGETRMGGFSAPDVQILVDDLVKAMRSSEEEVRDFVNMNRPFLEGIANMDIPQARIVRFALLDNPAPPPTKEQQLLKQLSTPDTGASISDRAPFIEGQGPGGGELLAPPGTGDYHMYNDPAAPMQSQNAEDAYYGGGYPGPSFLDYDPNPFSALPFMGRSPSERQTAPDYSTLEEVFPQQRARGGYVGRGTSAGELAPRGSMSVREAGETLYELAKRRRGMRGGGIMSLRR